MLPEALCTHATPTRLRLKVSARKGDRDFFTAVEHRLAGCAGVEKVAANPLTGSILVIHGGDVGAIAGFAAASGLFRVAFPDNDSLAGKTISLFREMDSGLRRSTGGALNLADASFVALVGTGVYQIARGKFAAPAWYTAFWYALNIFLKAHGNEKKEG